MELGEQLRAVGQLIDNKRMREKDRLLEQIGDFELQEEIDREAREALRKTLTGLRSFRRDYDYWERIVAEYALTKWNYTQRDTAKLLGVGVSTINRWAQNPLKIQDFS